MKGFGSRGDIWVRACERVGWWWWKHRFFVDEDHFVIIRSEMGKSAAATGREEPDLEKGDA
jgi:hypothetical protein